GVAHLRVVGHFGRRRVHRLGRVLGHLVGRGVGLFQAHALQLVGVRRFAVLAVLVLAALVVLALVALLLVVVARTVVAHVGGAEQVGHGVAEPALVPDRLLQLVGRAAGAAFDPRPPQVDQAPRRRRRRHAGQALAHHHGDRLLDRRVGTVGDLVEFAA